MARLRPARCYRKPKKLPYTRTSRYKRKSFIKGVPGSKIVKYIMGSKAGLFSHSLHLVADKKILIRHNSLESARMAVNRYLEKKVGKLNFGSKICVFPHHIMRENPIAAGAGSDRYSTGMKHSFGKSIGKAAIVNPRKIIISVWVNENNIEKAKEALRRARDKLPTRGKVVVKEVPEHMRITGAEKEKLKKELAQKFEEEKKKEEAAEEGKKEEAAEEPEKEESKD